MEKLIETAANWMLDRLRSLHQPRYKAFLDNPVGSALDWIEDRLEAVGYGAKDVREYFEQLKHKGKSGIDHDLYEVANDPENKGSVRAEAAQCLEELGYEARSKNPELSARAFWHLASLAVEGSPTYTGAMEEFVTSTRMLGNQSLEQAGILMTRSLRFVDKNRPDQQRIAFLGSQHFIGRLAKDDVPAAYSITRGIFVSDICGSIHDRYVDRPWYVPMLQHQLDLARRLVPEDQQKALSGIVEVARFAPAGHPLENKAAACFQAEVERLAEIDKPLALQISREARRFDNFAPGRDHPLYKTALQLEQRWANPEHEAAGRDAARTADLDSILKSIRDVLGKGPDEPDPPKIPDPR